MCIRVVQVLFLLFSVFEASLLVGLEAVCSLPWKKAP
jgi:hypothetical protein